MNAPGPVLTTAAGKLGWGRLIVFAGASMFVGALQLPLTVYLPSYYASQMALPVAQVGQVFLVVKLLDLLLDPTIGVAINVTRTRFGRFKPWMAVSVPLLLAASYALFMPRPGVGTGYLFGWLMVLYAGYSMGVVGHSAWAAALVPDYHERSRVYGWVQMLGVVTAVTSLSLPPLLAATWHASHAAGIQAMGWLVIIVAPITILLCTAAIAEPVQIKAEHIAPRDYWDLLRRKSMRQIILADLFLALGPGITASLYIFFFTKVLGYTLPQASILLLIYILAGFFGSPFWVLAARRYGKHGTVMMACVLYAFAQALVFLLPHANFVLMVAGMFLAGFVVSAFTPLIRSMVADVCDEVKLETGKDRIAILYSLVTMTSKVGGTISIGITYPILGYVGFKAVEGAANAPEAIWGLTACYVFVPVATMFVGALALRGYTLDAVRHGEIRSALEAREAALHGPGDVIDSLTGGSAIPAATFNAPF
jgi:Na+/melibiose symporter-like transporter